MWCYKGCIGKDGLPLAADLNEVVSIRAKAMQNDNQLPRLSRKWFDPWAVQCLRHVILLSRSLVFSGF